MGNSHEQHFATVFDSSYLVQALVMADSLLRQNPSSIIWMFCVDDDAVRVVEEVAKGAPRLRSVSVSSVEGVKLNSLRTQRAIGEFCWTLTPYLPTWVTRMDSNASVVTYVDADMYFLANPSELISEFEASAASALVTEHSYASEYDQTRSSGRFCVQFNSFKVPEASDILDRWQWQVADWCFAKFEGGKMGDQMYLDEWPQRYGKRIAIVGPTGEFQGPWNARRFPPSSAIAYHFHGLLWSTRGRVHMGNYYVPQATVEYLYRPYLEALSRKRHSLKQHFNVDFLAKRLVNERDFLRHRLRSQWNYIRSSRRQSTVSLDKLQVPR